MAKLEKFGGKPNCVVSTPEITVFPLNEDVDWILLGSDGVFDKMENKDI